MVGVGWSIACKVRGYSTQGKVIDSNAHILAFRYPVCLLPNGGRERGSCECRKSKKPHNEWHWSCVYQDETMDVKVLFIEQVVLGGPADRTGRVLKGDLFKLTAKMCKISIT